MRRTTLPPPLFSPGIVEDGGAVAASTSCPSLANRGVVSVSAAIAGYTAQYSKRIRKAVRKPHDTRISGISTKVKERKESAPKKTDYCVTLFRNREIGEWVALSCILINRLRRKDRHSKVLAVSAPPFLQLFGFWSYLLPIPWLWPLLNDLLIVYYSNLYVQEYTEICIVTDMMEMLDDFLTSARSFNHTRSRLFHCQARREEMSRSQDGEHSNPVSLIEGCGKFLLPIAVPSPNVRIHTSVESSSLARNGVLSLLHKRAFGVGLSDGCSI